MKNDKAKKITFISKKSTTCPICSTSFFKEELLTGGGRLIADDLKDDLRRIYEPSNKFGPVFPLIYSITVCPECYFSAFPGDFSAVPEKDIGNLKMETERRKKSIKHIFGFIDFREPRTLKEGAASYYFALMSYCHFPSKMSPTIKCGLLALRLAWVFQDLHRAYPAENYDYLEKIFYRKARFFYTLSIEYEGSGKEDITLVKNLGPDLDKNYGYDGVLYLSAYLEYRYGSESDPAKRESSLNFAKRSLAKLFGMGKASKEKPTPLLEKAKSLYKEIGGNLKAEEENESAQH